MTHWIPELLSPAGSLEKLRVAVLYGANAVYLGGQKFGLRQASDNFTSDELVEGVEFAHQRGCLVYVVLNSFLHDKDLEELPPFLQLLEQLKVDAVIVSDLGVIATVQKHSKLVIHLSTQASCLNVEAALFWKEMGVSRIVLGREVTIQEAKKIKMATGLEIEMFIHGSMCMSYSGNCVISNYTQGRDSNRGGCAQSCRFEYSIDLKNKDENDQALKAFFMSSKDLEGIRLMQDFIDAGIDSLKVEGRNKSHHYAATISKVYSDALRTYQQNGHFLSSDMLLWEKELGKISHRDYTTGSLKEYAGSDSIYDERQHDEHEYVICGVVLEVIKDQYILLDVKSAFFPGDILELMPFKENIQCYQADFIRSLSDVAIEKTKPGSVVKLPYHPNAELWNIIRKEA
jgi:putative protease